MIARLGFNESARHDLLRSTLTEQEYTTCCVPQAEFA
jgi:hypothetical protein